MKLKTSIFSTFVLCLTLSSLANADVGFNSNSELKAAAIAKFIKEANDPSSSISKIIAEHNKETSDGRNNEGTINPKVIKDSIQVVTVGAEEIMVPWHYGVKKNGSCNAGGDSATFMILLSAYQQVHYAQGFEVLAFSVDARQTMTAKIIKDSEDVFCEDLQGNEIGALDHFGPIKSSIEISNLKKIDLSAKQQ